MNLVPIYDSKDRIAEIDELVKNGVFSSRAEVYRMGAFLMITNQKAREFSKTSQLDPVLFGNHIKECLDFILNKNVSGIENELRFIINGMIFREILFSLQSKENERIVFETIREGLILYEKTLTKFENLNGSQRTNLFDSLERDLRILNDYVEKQKTELTRKRTLATGTIGIGKAMAAAELLARCYALTGSQTYETQPRSQNEIFVTTSGSPIMTSILNKKQIPVTDYLGV